MCGQEFVFTLLRKAVAVHTRFFPFLLFEYLSSALQLNKSLAVLIFVRAHEDLNREKRRFVNGIKKGYG